jgi:hypothetical protein
LAGTGSVTVTAAVVGPTPDALLTVRVKVPVPFCATVFVSGSFVIDSKGCAGGGTVTVAEAVCGAVGSPPPFTVAVFVYGEPTAEFADVVYPSVIAG